jgi:hypothetical protein
MPIKHAIWTVGEKPTPLAPGRLATERQLEEMIVAEVKQSTVEQASAS